MYFYHHVNSPQIQTIRNRFITELRQEKPALIIDILDKPEAKGPGTSQVFDELEQFIDENYFILVDTDGYVVYELIQ
jgi:hypothetical protein